MYSTQNSSIHNKPEAYWEFSHEMYFNTTHDSDTNNYQVSQWLQGTVEPILDSSERTLSSSSSFEVTPLHCNLDAGNVPALPEATTSVYQENNFHSTCPSFTSNNHKDYLQKQNQVLQEPYEKSIWPLMTSRQPVGVPEKFHRAHITFHQKSNGGLKAVIKRKRKRTMFTTEQIAILESIFASKPYINKEDREELVKQLQINDRAIKVWFQNRRLREKREKAEAEEFAISSPNFVHSEENKYQFDRLSYVESKLNETDERGYVTLDSRAMSELISVIDNLLSKETNLNKFSEEISEDVKSESSTIYEPISPAASSNTSDEDNPTWEPFEPKDSLQCLFDMRQFLRFNKPRNEI